jgi:hypothetical protein
MTNGCPCADGMRCVRDYKKSAPDGTCRRADGTCERGLSDHLGEDPDCSPGQKCDSSGHCVGSPYEQCTFTNNPSVLLDVTVVSEHTADHEQIRNPIRMCLDWCEYDTSQQYCLSECAVHGIGNACPDGFYEIATPGSPEYFEDVENNNICSGPFASVHVCQKWVPKVVPLPPGTPPFCSPTADCNAVKETACQHGTSPNIIANTQIGGPPCFCECQNNS